MNKVLRKESKANRRQFALDYLGNKCTNCGATKQLEFDHIIPSTKSFNICHYFELSEATLKVELDKCQLLCKKCHAAKTLRDRGLNPSKHGDVAMYTNHKCRCDACRKAWADNRRGYQREYRKNKRLMVV